MPRFSIVLPVITLLASLTQTASAMVFDYRSMNIGGTPVAVTVWAEDAAACRASMEAGFRECQRLDQLLSAYRQGSEVSAINQFGGQRPITVSPETLRLFEWARQIYEKTQGIWDPTTATFLWQYGFGQGDYHVPSVLRLDQLKPMVNYRLVMFYRGERTVLFKRAGVQLDLDDLIRSDALNRLPSLLKSKGARSAVIRIRNHEAVLGAPVQGTDWIFNVLDPRDPKRPLTAIPFRKGKILSAGVYERCFVEDGKRYHPFVEARTGLPAAYSQAATLYLPDRTKLDLPVSALMLMPAAQALSLVQTIPGAECLIMDAEGKVWLTPGWSRLTLAK